MSANETIRLLILNDSRAEVERLISMLNNAGHPTRAQHVESEEALTKLLQEQPWELMIADMASSEPPPGTAARQIKRLNKDVPLILVTEDEDRQQVVEGLKMGATDVVQLDQDQHLLLVIQRELHNREQRHQKRQADRRLKEVERRNQQLLDSSRDAIAYVQDGMYLYANQSFAERFGYAERDDIECMPVIDMIADNSQGEVKQFLKEFTLKGDEAESCQLSFHGLREDGSPCKLNVDVANAIYDEESCVQFLIPAQSADNEELQAELQKIKDQDLVTGLYNRQYLVEQLEIEANNAVDNETTSCLLYIEIDNFAENVQPQMGIAGSDVVLGDVAAFVKQRTQSHETLARFGDDAFMLLAPQQSADDSLERAQQLVGDLEQHIVDVEGKTVQLTVTIGIALINETSSNTETAIDHALRAVEIYRENNEGAGNGVQLFEPELPEGAVDESEMHRLLQHALDNNRFQLLFQPIISLRGAEDELYEILLRMQDEENELISPAEFMDMANQIGATTKIDRWVVLEAIKMLAEHRGNGHKTRAIINLSRQSLCDETLVPWLSVAFKAAKLPTDAIVFQVDEVDVTNHLTSAKSFFESLKEIRSFSSISNFGCSLNPFNTLQHAPADYVKVHGSFTLDIQNNNESPETLSNLIKQLLEANKISIVPFVENASVLSVLWQTGVHYIQGHYLQAPTASMDYDFTMEG
jgi:diguanylate cyclase (GGDEF)-like protein/PAS domain S-box-containing protein